MICRPTSTRWVVDDRSNVRSLRRVNRPRSPSIASTAPGSVGLGTDPDSATSAVKRLEADPVVKQVEADSAVKQLEAELARARAALAAVNPRLPQLVLPQVPSSAALSALLPAGVTAVSYVPTRERLLIFVLRRDAPVRLHTVKVGRAELARTVKRHREALRRFHTVDTLAARLHDWLIAPLGRLAARLLIVPGGVLHLVPFAALQPRGAEPLVARHTVSYLSAVSALSQPRGADGGTRVSFGWAGRGDRPLSFALRESEAFGAAFPGAIIVQGALATRGRFVAEASKAGLLHVATHGEFRARDPLSTALKLADGELTLLEVLGLKLRPGALVILSACDTGSGPVDGADAVVGLHRAFRVAGAGRVISSLWRVSDLGAALTMKHLFRALARELSPAAALRAAQNRLRGRFSHPAFWAAFRLSGRP